MKDSYMSRKGVFGRKGSRGGGESELELLRGKNKALMKEIRQLRKQLEILENHYSSYVLNNREKTKEKIAVRSKDKGETDEPNHSSTNLDLCPSCHKGELKKVDIETPFKILRFHVCRLCNYRIKIQ